MPYGRRKYNRPNRHGRRAAMARRIQRAYRRRRFRSNLRRRAAARRRRPTVRSLANSVRRLYRRDDKKYFYLADPDLPVDSTANWTQLGALQALNSCPAADAGLSVWNMREIDSVSCNLKTIRIHMLVEKHLNNLDRNRYCPYYIILLKTTNHIGSTGGITYPDLDEFFDPQADPALGNRLSRFDTFRNTQGPGSETLTNTKVLKVWSGTLQSAGMLQQTNLETVGTSGDVPPAAAGSIENDAGAGAPANCNFQARYPSKVLIKYTHKCNNAKVMFDAASGPNAMNPINNHYYLLAAAPRGATGPGVGARDFYNVSTMIKINYVDE